MAAVSALLMSPLTLPLALSFLLLYISLRAYLNWRALRQFKGPLLAKFTSLWLFWQSACSRLSSAEFDALQQYGKPPPNADPPAQANPCTIENRGIDKGLQARRVASAHACLSPTMPTSCAT